MRKVTLIALLAIVGLVANAQKGSILMSGDVGFTSKGGENIQHNFNSFSLSPQLGYGITNNIHVGIKGTGAFYSQDIINGNMVMVAPFVRYTKMFGETFGVFADAHLGWMNQYDDALSNFSVYNNVNTGGEIYTGFNFGIMPRALVNINKGFGLTFGFGGLSYTIFGKTENQATSLDLNFGKQFSVGVQKVFGGKK